ncbi:MAG: hypothetical protein JNK14_12965 [Chitinophagaceae bacterium]|nr:hypothetical protein [Chitinophagaceae bacterium]
MRSVLLLSVCFLLLAGCAKKLKPTDRTDITGKWRLTEQYVSIGGPGSWQPFVSLLPVIVEFHANGEFTYSIGFPKASLQLNRYSFAGNSLSMSSTLNTNTDTWPVHSLADNKLEISVYTCFEGCAYRFTSVE